MKTSPILAATGIAAMALFSLQQAGAATIDFNGFSNGANVTTAGFGFGSATVSASGGIGEAWAYDTNNHSNGDPDLFGPFSTADSSVTGYNAGKVLIIQENNGRNTTPDDNASGGSFNLNFSAPLILNSLDVMDMELGKVTVRLFDDSSTQIGGDWNNLTNTDTGNSTFPNLFETIQFGGGISGVKSMQVILGGSGAIDNINVSAVPLPAAAPLFASALGLFGFLRSRRRPLAG
jgi:hypothetical protein